MINYSKLTSADCLELALRCRHNAVVLRDSANAAFANECSKNHALFHLHTASEEFQKGFFCLLAHRGILRPQQLGPIFSNHETKTILFKMIYDNPKFYVKGGRFYYDGILLQNLNLNKITKDHNLGRDYKTERESCLYVTINDDGTSNDPSFMPKDVEEKRKQIMEQISALWGLFDVIWMHDFEGDLGNFLYMKVSPKDKPVRYNITFSGSGSPTKRTDYFPDNVKKRLKEYPGISS